MAKGLKYVSQLSRLARTTKGVSGEHIRRLTVAVVIPKMTYAGDVWFTPIRLRKDGKTIGSQTFAKKLASVQRLAAIHITGAMRTSPGDLLDLHAHLWPIPLLMDKICYRSALRLSTLTEDHPLYRHVTRSARKMVKGHPSPMHHIFDAYKLQPELIEKIPAFHHNTKWSRSFAAEIAPSREIGIEQDRTSQAVENIMHIYTDGSADEHYVGAAAIILRDGEETKRLTYRLGTTSEHTVFEAEAVGLILGAHLLARERGTEARFGVDNTAVIKSSRRPKARPGHYLLREFHMMVERQHRQREARGSGLDIEVVWTPGHEGIVGNELADQAAKTAAMGLSSRRRELPGILRKTLPLSISALRRAHTEELKQKFATLWKDSPRYARMQHIDPEMSPSKLRRMLLGRKRAQASIITQLRLGHSPLNKHLHRINRSDTALCAACRSHLETTRHYILKCPRYDRQRRTMFAALGRGGDRLRNILSTPRGIEQVLRFIQTTGRFRHISGRLS